MTDAALFLVVAVPVLVFGIWVLVKVFGRQGEFGTDGAHQRRKRKSDALRGNAHRRWNGARRHATLKGPLGYPAENGTRLIGRGEPVGNIRADLHRSHISLFHGQWFLSR